MIARSLFAFAIVLSLAAPAGAQVRVAVGPIEGSAGAATERAITRELEERGLEVVEASSEADASVEGRASFRGSRRRRTAQVRLEVRAAGEVREVEMRVRARQLARVGREVASEVEALAPAPEEPAPVAAAPATPRVTPRPPAPVREPEAERAPVQVLLQVGAGVRSRAVQLLAPDGLDAAYRAEPYFEITARAEARFFDVAFVRALFGSSAGLSSEREDPALGTLDTWFAWMRADAGASVLLGETVELGGAIGAGWDRYELAYNELVPTAEYVHLRLAALTSFRLIRELLVLDAEAGLRIPFGVGDLESLHGREHEVLGADFVMRVHGAVDPGFTWAIEAGARRYWLSFTRPDGLVSGDDSGWHVTGWAGWRFR